MTTHWKSLLAIAFALPLAAHAKTVPADQPGDQTIVEEKTTELGATPEVSIRHPTLGLIRDIGVSNYNRDFGDVTNPGWGYGLRVDLEPIRNLGLELGWEGAVNPLASRVSSDGSLTTNALGGDLRFNLVPAKRDLPAHLKPFILGGAMYQRVSTDNFTPGIKTTNAFALPVGLGVEADIGNTFLIGARYTYNFLFNEFDNFGGRNADNWWASINLGARLGN